MRFGYRNVTLLLVAVIAAMLMLTGTATAAGGWPYTPGQQTFMPSSNSCYQTYTVPQYVTELGVTAIGGTGENGQNNVVDGTAPSSFDGKLSGNAGNGQPGGLGGLGTEVDTTISVTPGETLYVGPASEAFPGGSGGLAGMNAGQQPATPTAQAAEPGAGGGGGDASFVSTAPPTGGSDGTCSFTASELQNDILVIAAGGGGGGGAGSGQDDVLTNGLIAADPGGNGGSEAGDAAQIGGGSLWHSIATVSDDENNNGDQDEGTAGSGGSQQAGGSSGTGGFSVSTIPDWPNNGVSTQVAGVICIAGDNGTQGLSTTGGAGGSAAQAPASVPDDMASEMNLQAFLAAESGAGASGLSGDLSTVASIASFGIDQLLANPDAPQVWVDGCGGEDDNTGWNPKPAEVIPGLSSGGGGGGGGGYYGGGGGGGADDYYINAGGGGGGAGASYVQGDTAAQLASQSSMPSTDPEVELSPIETAPTITTSDPTLSCTIFEYCSLSLNSSGYLPPQFGYTAGAANLPNGLEINNPTDSQGYFTNNATIAGTPNDCSQVGNYSYSGEIQAVNDAGSATLANLNVDLNPGTPEGSNVQVDSSGNTTIGGSTGMVAGSTPTIVEADVGYTSNCTYDISNSSAISWSVSGSQSLSGGSLSNNAVVTLQSVPDSADPSAGQEQITPVGPGTATVSFTYTDPWGNTFTNSLEVTVSHGAPQSIYFTNTSLSIVPGQDTTPQVMGNFGNGDIENITNSVSYEGVPSDLNEAGISVVNGQVQAGSPLFVGTTPSVTDSLTAYLGAQTAKLPVTVSFNDPSSITLQANAAMAGALPAGSSSGQLTATAYYAGNAVPANVSELVNWSTSDSDRAQVQNGGGGGTVDVPSYTLGGPVTLSASLGGASASYQAEIQLGTPTSMTLADPNNNIGSGSLPLGSDEQLSVTGYVGSDSDNITNQVTDWSSSDPSVVQVNSQGVINAVGAGDGNPVQITANDNNVVATFNVTVNLDAPQQITITPNTTTVPLGSYVNFTATGTYVGGVTANITSLVAWSTSNPALGTFQTPGLLLTGDNSQGLSATVYATLNGQQGQATVNEQGQAPDQITATGASQTLQIGSSEQLTATAQFANNTTSNVTGTVTWSSGNTSLFTVSSAGVLTAVGSDADETGNYEAPIYATLTYNSGGTKETLQAQFNATISFANPTSITITPPSQNLFNLSQLPFTATGTYANGATADLSYLANWTTSNTADSSFAGNTLSTDNLSSPASTTITASYSGVSATYQAQLVGPMQLNGPAGGTGNLTGTIGQTKSYTFNIAGGSGSYNWEVINTYTNQPMTLSPGSDVQLSSTSGDSVTLSYTPNAADYNTANPPGTSPGDYYFEVEAVDPTTGISVQQQLAVNITRLTQTLSWVQTLPASFQYGTSTFLSGSSSAGLQTTISQPYSDPNDGCTISSSGQVQFNVAASASCEVELSQAGNGSYAPASIITTIPVTASADFAWAQADPPPAEAVVGSQQDDLYALSDQEGTSEPQDGGAISYSIDPSTTNAACAIAGHPGNGGVLIAWNNAGSCVLDATIAAYTNSYGFSFPQTTVSETVPVIGDQDYPVFSSSVPTKATVGGSYTPKITAESANSPYWDPLGAGPSTPSTVTIDATNSSPSNACSTNGTSVTFLHAGTCMIQDTRNATGQFQAEQAFNQSVAGLPDGNYSQVIQVAAAAQKISFPSIVTSAYIPGDSVTLNPAGGASGNAVTLSVDPSSTDTDNPGSMPCSVSGNTVTFADAGNCVIDANQGGNSDYNAAPQLQQTFKVQHAQLALVSSNIVCSNTNSSGNCTQYGTAPLTATASSTASTPVTVELENAQGQPVNAPADMTVTLSGSGGNAQFQNGSGGGQLVIPAGSSQTTGYYGDTVAGTDQLSASAQLNNAAQTQISGSAPVTNQAGPAASVSWSNQPSDGSAGQYLPYASAELQDQYGNPVSGTNVTVAATNTSTNSTVTVQNNSAQTDSTGTAGFPQLEIDTPGTYKLTATAAGLSSSSSAPVTITPGPVASLSFSEQPAGGNIDQGMEIKVQALDSVGNGVPNVTIALSLNGSGQLSGTTTEQTGSDGTATFTDIGVSEAGTDTITANDAADGLSQPSNQFTINPPASGLTSAYVAPTGNDNNNCSSVSTPCATITGAESELSQSSATTIHVSGTIDESGIQLTNPNLTIAGVTGSSATIDGQQSGDPIFSTGALSPAGNSTTLTGLKIENGSASQGGAINDLGPGDITVDNSSFSDNAATSGGGGAIFANGGGTVTVDSSLFSGNTASTYGGAIDNGDAGAGTLVVESSTFTGNSAYVGGAVDNGENGGGASSTMTLLGSTFARDGASGAGPEVVTGQGQNNYAADLFAQTSGSTACAGTGTWNDLGYNAASDASCLPNPVAGDAPANTAANDLTAASDGQLQPTTGNPALELIPSGTTVSAGSLGTVELCSATDKSALFTPGASGKCNAGADQTQPGPTAQSTALTISVSPASIPYGASVKVTGKLTSQSKPLAGQTVTLQYRAAGSSGAWLKFATTAKSSSTGAVSFSFAPKTPVQIELSFAATSHYKATTSTSVDVAMSRHVTLTAPSKDKRGQTVHFSGTVTPATAGTTIHLQLKTAKGWVNVAGLKLAAKGDYSFAVKLTKTGSFSYRTAVPSAGGFSATDSSSATVKVG